jgi:hypothetical protein
VAKAGHSIEGILGTHMLLWVLPQDLVVRTWGSSVDRLDLESRGGTQRVAPEAAYELKAQAEAKLHMYCYVLG